MPVGAEVDTLDRERRHYLLDDELLMDVVEDNLAVKADRAHQELVEGTEAEALHAP